MSCICEIITEGEYTPDDASAAPKRAPAVEVVKKSVGMVRMMTDRIER